MTPSDEALRLAQTPSSLENLVELVKRLKVMATHAVSEPWKPGERDSENPYLYNDEGEPIASWFWKKHSNSVLATAQAEHEAYASLEFIAEFRNRWRELWTWVFDVERELNALRAECERLQGELTEMTEHRRKVAERLLTTNKELVNCRETLPVCRANEPGGEWPCEWFYNGYWLVKRSIARRILARALAAESLTERLRAELETARKDSERLDFLEHMTVNVRTPLVHGSRDLFWAAPIDVDGDEQLSPIRNSIDHYAAAEKGAKG